MKEKSAQDMAAIFLKKFDSFQKEFAQATQKERLRFGNAAKGCVSNARQLLLEAKEFVMLSLNEEDSNNARTNTSDSSEV